MTTFRKRTTMKKILILFVFAAAALGAQAKLGYIRTSLGYTPLYLSSNVRGFESQTLHGGSVSMALGIKTYKNLFVEAGAGIQVNGGKCPGFIDELDKADPTGASVLNDILNSSTVMVRLNVPVNLTYRFEFAKIFAVAPYAGINFGFNLYAYSGQNLFNRSGDVITDFLDLKYTYNPKRFQMGWQAGVNISVIGLTVGVGYQGNFSSFDAREYLPEYQGAAIAAYGDDTPRIRMGNLVVSLGWGF